MTDLVECTTNIHIPFFFLAMNRSARDVMIAALAVSHDTPGVYARWVERDVMTAVEHMVLAAWSLGYCSCWIGAFVEGEVKEILEIYLGI